MCPWELNKGCTVVADSGYYLVCASGCSAKTQCAPVAANAYYTGPGTTALNCPYNCQDNFYMLENGTCVRVPGALELPVPTSSIRRCYAYNDCNHCPRAPYKGTSFYNVWGCSGYELRLSAYGNTYLLLGDIVLLRAYCIYYTNDTDVHYCPEPVVTTTPAPSSGSGGGSNVSVTTSVMVSGTPPPFTNPSYRCRSYSNCSFCPGPYTSGCSGVNVVQRFADGRYGVVLKNFAPSGMMQGFCVYLKDGAWGYCPDNSSVSSEPPLAKVGVSFWFNVPETTVDSVVLAKYRRKISVLLGISEDIIELMPAFSQGGSRRLLADNLVYANMELDPAQASAVNALINQPNFFLLLSGDGAGGNQTALVGTTAVVVANQSDGQPASLSDGQPASLNAGQTGNQSGGLSNMWIAVIVGVVFLLIIGAVAVGIVVGCSRTQSYMKIPKERVIAVRLRC